MASAVLPVSVEATVQVTDTFLQIVSVVCHHSVSNHPLLPNRALKFVSTKTLQPHWSSYNVFGMYLKISQNANVVINSKHCPLLCPSVHHLKLWDGRSLTTAANT